MLSDMAIAYYNQGYSCSCCIIKGAEKLYGISAKDTQRALSGINNGFGIGIMCSVPISCIMVLGLLYKDESTLKQKRLEFLLAFKKTYKSFNCSEIQSKIYSCEEVIRKGCDILENLTEN